MLRRGLIGALGAAAVVLAFALNGQAAVTVPVPNPIVVVTTTSGTVTKTTLVPIGGAPIPIDVDGRKLLGLLCADIDVSVGLVELEGPGSPLVPSIEIKRNVLALTRNTPSPPLTIDAKIELLGVGEQTGRLAEIHYGYTTPPGGSIPTRLKAKLTGGVGGAFIDPLKAAIEAPGYRGPLNLKLGVTTPDLDAAFGLNFDTLPEQMFVTEDPTDDGVNARFSHWSPVDDVVLDATASVRDLHTQHLLEASASIERLPQDIAIDYASTSAGATIDYTSASDVANPDLDASYRDSTAGTVGLDARLRLSGLPHRMHAQIDKDADGVTGVAFDVLDGESVGAVDFSARNVAGPDVVPAPDLAPDQYVALSTRRQADGSVRWRAGGLLREIRSASFVRDGDSLRLGADIGDGRRGLRALADLDSRGADGGTRLLADARLAPLPRDVHVTLTPGTEQHPGVVDYQAQDGTDVDVDLKTFGGPGDSCGVARSTCLIARLDDLPTALTLTLPGLGQSELGVTHSGVTDEPDVLATLDRTGETTTDRVWADIALRDIPPVVRGRLDASADGNLNAAEFHACDYDASSESCRDQQRALGLVRFTVRDQPDRLGLPQRPRTADTFISIVGNDPNAAVTGDERFEAAGRVEQVRNLAFHQRAGASTAGALVDLGTGRPFDAVISTKGFKKTASGTVLGPTSTDLRVHVGQLPNRFGACLRGGAATPPPDPSGLSPDSLLAPCERDDAFGGNLAATPLSLAYDASGPTTVSATGRFVAPDAEHPGGPADVTSLDTTVDQVPAHLRADVLAGDEAVERPLQIHYDAHDSTGQPAPIGRIVLKRFEQRKAGSLCGDPRPGRQATCADAELDDLPASIDISADPAEARGDFSIATAEPQPGRARPSLQHLHLSAVKPDAGSRPFTLDASVTGLTPRLSGRVRRLDLDPSAAGTELAELSVSACRDATGADRCTTDGSGSYGRGVGDIHVRATNSAVPEALPEPPARPGISHTAALVVRSGEFVADADIPDFRELGVSRLDPGDEAKVLRSTRMRVGFGSGLADEHVRAYVDQVAGAAKDVLDATLDDAPRSVVLCTRGPVADTEVRDVDGVWCEGQEPAESVMQARLEGEVPVAERPDITLNRLLLARGGRASVIQARGAIHNIGGRIDMVTGREQREGGGGPGSCADGTDNDGVHGADADDPACVSPGPEITIEGRDADGDLADVAGRIDLTAQNYYAPGDDTLIAPPGPGFPATDLKGQAGDAGIDPDNADPGDASGDPGGHNYLSAALSGGDVYGSLSVPHFKHFSLKPGPCYTDGRVRAAADLAAENDPHYRCVRVVMAQRDKVGLTFRAQTAPGTVLDLEDGQIDRMPAGDGGFSATIAQPAAGQDTDPWCEDAITAPQAKCNPPLISLESDHDISTPGPDGAGTDVVLRGRVNVGDPDVIARLAGLGARDVVSSRLDYDQDFDAWDPVSKGIRAKVGNAPAVGRDGQPVSNQPRRVGATLALNMSIPRYLDISPPIMWDCLHTGDSTSECNAPEVGSDQNTGRHSNDTFIKVVGSNTAHDGSDLPYLGRLALLVHDFETTDEKVISGAPAPDDNSIFNPDGPGQLKGASSLSPDDPARLPTGDPSTYGMQLPGHLDLRVMMREDFAAQPDYQAYGLALQDRQNQQRYFQVDGRINRPLSFSVRLNSPQLQQSRSGLPVSNVTMAAYNLPARPDVGSSTLPSFRIRSELRMDYTGKEYDVQRAKALYDTFKDGFSHAGVLADILSGAADFNVGFDGGVITPKDIKLGWIDAKFNADPQSNGRETTANAARTVDVVAGPFGWQNDVELRGFRDVNDTLLEDTDAGGLEDVGKGLPAPVTLQAAARVQNIDIGYRVGLSAAGILGAYIGLAERLDAEIGVTAAETTRLRMANLATALSTRTSADRQVDFGSNNTSQLRIQGFVQILWTLHKVLDNEFPPGNDPDPAAPLGLFGCSLLGADDNDYALILGPGSALPDDYDVLGWGVQKLFSAATTLLSPLSCAVGAIALKPDQAMVDDRHPAPRYDAVGHPVEGALNNAASPAPDRPLDPQPRGSSLHVTAANSPVTRCGALSVDELTVDAGTRLVVGKEGQTDDVGVTCDGTLQIDAGKVTVDGTITASGTRTQTDGRGSPGSAAGAGHSGKGAQSGGNPVPGGLPYGEDVFAASPLEDAGSRGGASSSGAKAAGGGVVVINSASTVQVNGLIAARGASGEDYEPDDCEHFGGGGASGGLVQVTALQLYGTGQLLAAGGDGGDGGFAGGAGGGGRVEAKTIAPVEVDRNADAGHNGNHACGNAPAGHADSGDDGIEEVQFRGAIADLNSANPGPVQFGNDIKVHAEAIAGDDTGVVFICRESADPGDASKLQSTALDPVGDSVAAMVLNSDGCEVGAVKDSNRVNDRGPHEHSMTLDFDNLPEGWHGFWAVAARSKNGNPCAPSAFVANCAFQSALPEVSTARIGIDRTGPEITGATFSGGTEGCPGASRCVTANHIQINPTIRDVMGNVASAYCGVSQLLNGTYRSIVNNDCAEDGARDVPLGLFDGPREPKVVAEDERGTDTTASIGKVFVDTNMPVTQKFELTYPGDTAVNGWHHVVPRLDVEMYDNNPASGFADRPVRLIVDGDPKTCGDAKDGTDTVGGGVVTTCAPDVLDGFVPDDGIHQLTLSGLDRAGNRNYESAPQEIRIDHVPPKSSIVLDLQAPDGDAGWFVTRPQYAFAVADPGGSSDGAGPQPATGPGIDPGDVRVRLDNGAWHDFDPTADNRLPEGSHEICWYAVDLAGNPESDVESGGTLPARNCSGNRRTDVTAPEVQAVVDLPQSGPSGYIRGIPTVTATASDPQAADVNEISGVQVIEMQLDDEPWAAVDHVRVDQEGQHTVRARALDRAGNVADVLERTVLVDLERPTSSLGRFPEQANVRGWYRRPVEHSAVTRDSRDGSGPEATRTTLDGGPALPYTARLLTGAGSHTVTASGRDVAGYTGDAVSATVRTDVTPPSGAPVGQTAAILVGGVPTLRFTASDDTGGKVRVRICVFDELANLVACIPAGDGYRPGGPGEVIWPARYRTGVPIAPGLYHYRVEVIDEAGNSSASGESLNFLVVKLL